MSETEAARAAVEALGDCPAVPVWPERATQRQVDAICVEYAARCKAWAEAKNAAWLTLAREQWRANDRLAGALETIERVASASLSSHGCGPSAETEAHEVTRAALAAVERDRDEARAELAAAQDRLTWPRWVRAPGGMLLLRLPSHELLATVWAGSDEMDAGWRAWHGLSGSGCPWEQGAGGIEEAEAYLVRHARIRAGCTIRPETTRSQPARTNGCLACGGTGQGLGLHPCDSCQGGAR